MPIIAKRIAAAAMLMLIPVVASAAPMLVESRPSLELSTPSLAAPVELGESGSAFRYEGRPEVDIGSSEAGGPSLQTRMFETQALVRCRVEDSDLLIANVGTDAIGAGMTIRWQVKASGQRGYFNLDRPLEAGSSLRARDALGRSGAGEERCSARAL